MNFTNAECEHCGAPMVYTLELPILCARCKAEAEARVEVEAAKAVEVAVPV